jgi:hypothetical protein
MGTERRRALARPGRGLWGVRAWLSLALLLSPAAARAQAHLERELEVGLSYRVPRSCPPGSLFLESLREQLSAGDGPVDTDVQIVRRPATDDFELRLQLRVAGRRFRSVATSPSCETLVRLAALNAGIARTAPRDAPVVELTPAPAPTPAPPAAPLTQRLAPAAGEDSGTASTPPASGAGSRGLALVAVRTAHAMLPERAWGEGAAAGLEHGPWSLRLTGLWWGSRTEHSSIDGSSPLSLGITQASLELAPCAGSELTGALRLGGCLLLAGHRVHTSEAEAHVFGTVGATALLSARLWRGLRLELQGGLQAAPAAPRIHVARRIRFYRAEVLQPIAQLALGWEFGASPATLGPEPASRPETNDVREAAR